MGFVRVAPLALFFLATSIMFSMKNIEVAACSGVCSLLSKNPCGSSDCLCFPSLAPSLGVCVHRSGLSSSVAKMMDEHPNLCESDEECMKKGSGNFCARYPNTDYGWCFNSGSDELKGFLAMPRAISK